MFKKLFETIKDGSISAIASTVSQINELKSEVGDRINQTDEITDDRFYAIAEEEVDQGSYDRGLWSKALICANGNESMRKIEYMKLRVNQLQQMKLRAVKDNRAYVATAITVEQTPPQVEHVSAAWKNQTVQICLNFLSDHNYNATHHDAPIYGGMLKITAPNGENTLVRGREELFLFMEQTFGPYQAEEPNSSDKP